MQGNETCSLASSVTQRRGMRVYGVYARECEPWQRASPWSDGHEHLHLYVCTDAGEACAPVGGEQWDTRNCTGEFHLSQVHALGVCRHAHLCPALTLLAVPAWGCSRNHPGSDSLPGM